MKRTPLKRKAPLKAKTPIKQRSAKKAAYRASDVGKRASDYMALVKQLPCVITGLYGCDAHHCQSGRLGSRKASDFDVIPLHPSAHRAEYGPGAYHHNKREWEATHGPDTDYIEATRAAVLERFGFCWERENICMTE